MEQGQRPLSPHHELQLSNRETSASTRLNFVQQI